jgi:hypothetical protein
MTLVVRTEVIMLAEIMLHLYEMPVSSFSIELHIFARCRFHVQARGLPNNASRQKPQSSSTYMPEKNSTSKKN